MAKVTMKLEGLDALKRAVTKAPEDLRRESSDAVRQSAWDTADRMRRSVPVKSGTLLTAIEARVPVRGLTGGVEIGSQAFYWRFLEYGTVNMSARPFVRPAAEMEATPFLNRFREIATRMERNWGKG